MERIVKYTLVFGVAAFFAVMWGTLLRRHLPGPQVGSVQPNYERLLPPGESERSETWDVYFGRRIIGTSRVKVWREPGGIMNIETKTTVDSPAVRLAMGLSGAMEVKFEARISPLHGPVFFAVMSDALGVYLTGEPRGEKVRLRGRAGGQRVDATVPNPLGAFLGNSLSPMVAVGELSKSHLGRVWTVNLINPLSGKMENTAVQVTKVRAVEIDGERTRCFELTFTGGNGRWRSWVTGDGQMLVQGTPVGLVLRRRDLPAGALPGLSVGSGPGVNESRSERLNGAGNSLQ